MRPFQILKMRAPGGAPYTAPASVGAHRYWAIAGYGPGFSLGSSYYWNVGEAQFLDGNLAPITSGSAISTTTFSGFPASNGFDGDTSSLVSLDATAAQAGTGLCYLGRDFGSAVTVSAARLYAASPSATWTVIYSDDGTTWTQVATPKTYLGNSFYQVVQGFNEPSDVSPSSATVARLVVMGVFGDGSGARCSAAEVEFLVSGVDQTTGGTPFSSSADVSFPDSNAFDNDSSTVWTSASGDSNRYQYVGYTFSSTQAVAAFSYRQRGTSAVGDETPHALVLQRASSTAGPWTTVKWRTLTASLALGQQVVY